MVQLVCTPDGGRLVVTNPNDAAVQVDVTGPRQYENRVTVEAGETATFEELGNGRYEVRTLAGDAAAEPVGDAEPVVVTCRPAAAPQPEVPPPTFDGCSAVTVLSNGTATEWQLVLAEGGDLTTENVTPADGEDVTELLEVDQRGLQAYRFAVEPDGPAVVGVRNVRGDAGYVNPSFDLDAGTCEQPDAVAVGEEFDWTEQVGPLGASLGAGAAGSPPSLPADAANAVPLLGLFAAAGLVARRR